MTPNQQPASEVVVVSGSGTDYDCLGEKDRPAKWAIICDVSSGTDFEFVDEVGNTVTLQYAYVGLRIDAWIVEVTTSSTVDEVLLGFE